MIWECDEDELDIICWISLVVLLFILGIGLFEDIEFWFIGFWFCIGDVLDLWVIFICGVFCFIWVFVGVFCIRWVLVGVFCIIWVLVGVWIIRVIVGVLYRDWVGRLLDKDVGYNIEVFVLLFFEFIVDILIVSLVLWIRLLEVFGLLEWAGGSCILFFIKNFLYISLLIDVRLADGDVWEGKLDWGLFWWVGGVTDFIIFGLVAVWCE